MGKFKNIFEKFKFQTCFITLIIFMVILELSQQIQWLTLGKEAIQWHSRGKATQCELARRKYGLVRRQEKVCRSSFEAMPFVAKAAEQTFETCQQLFEKRRWNCSTILTAPQFTPDLTTGTREQAFVYALSSASIVYTLSKACASGGLFNCSCSERPDDPPNGNFKWGGCGDNIQWGLKFGKYFTDAGERKQDKKKGETGKKKKRGGLARGPEHSLDVVMGSMVGGEKLQRKSRLGVVNLQNNRAGRRAIQMSVKTQCKCHGVSGSCSIKICWKALPRFVEIGERLQKKYGTSVEVVPRKFGHGRKLIPVSSSQYFYNEDDLVYVTKSPDYCLRDDKTGSLGTRGSCMLYELRARETARLELFPTGMFTDGDGKVRFEINFRFEDSGAREKRSQSYNWWKVNKKRKTCACDQVLCLPRPCNKTSNDHDSCEIMCCGRGHVTLTVQKIEMCKCKFHWCCTVACKKCLHWVDTHICN